MEKLPVYQIKKFNCHSEENDLYFNDFKTHLIANDFIENSHSHNFYLLVLFTKGSGFHTIDFNTYAIQPNSLFVLKPGQVHSWQLSEDIGGYIAFYSQEVYNVYFGNKQIDEYSFYRDLKNSPEMILNEIQTQEISTYFKLLLEENNKNEFKKIDKLLNLLDVIHIELARIYESQQDHNLHSYNVKINELEQLVNQYFKTEKLPSFYADKMNMSLKHLNRICKNILNITLTEFIYNKIILESKRLLSANNMTIGEVANELGFENYSYFTKVFKKYTNLTPKGFKELV
ncbi:AraC family transcriptional regulator [Flavobacterium terrigena]|uniref:AraC-type DNA-binding protein n=1 Tax=Flavobacterium terrigena TaxID=402734 RepID=A0A1H6QQU6_9FLAO|nr:helix-turn-helix domain-containing protein [Flavobacterium terrigena]SEI45953.1 AraC-type DNA-binding protein [Flavobacterium terrigena]